MAVDMAPGPYVSHMEHSSPWRVLRLLDKHTKLVLEFENLANG